MKSHLLIFVLLIASLCSNAATNVILEHSETLSFSKKSGRDYQILRGNVRFSHEGAVMYCDSAYFYDTNNSFDAFGNVRVVQDTMSLNSESLYYDGNTRVMKVRGNVVLRNGQMTLTTDWLDYFRDANYGYYSDGGKLVDPNFTITSNVGYYHPKAKLSFFKGNVKLVNPEYSIVTDSLKSNDATKVASVFGPSEILYSDYVVKTTYAWTNTQTQYGHLYNYSVLTGKDGSFMTADSIHFSREEGTVELFHNAVALDDSTHTGFSGDYANLKRHPDKGFIVGKACMMDYSNPNDTMYLHGDTIRFFSDTTGHRHLFAYHKVKLFSLDLQGKCDSLTYLQADSLIRLDGTPVIWSDVSQMAGDTIKIYTKGTKPDWMHIEGSAFIIQQQAKDCFDQLSGKESKAYLEGTRLKQVDMMSGATSLYYAQDDRSRLIGVNKCEGPMLSIFLKNNKMEHIKMTPESKGTMFPPGKLPEGQDKLRGFNNRNEERPKSKDDIFIW